ncbi:hypothetical protein Tco_1019900 [Tanacetum coccineum]|uniref:Uncharacterized protein n=1 Tax=Tanacetum coccineum TaxID=301880 RepID=A0ABQ5FYH8_9ASTR
MNIQYRRECEIRIDKLKRSFNGMSIEIRKKEKELLQKEHAAYVSTSQLFNFIYDDDDNEESSIPLSDVISELPSYEVIKSSIEDLVPIPILLIAEIWKRLKDNPTHLPIELTMSPFTSPNSFLEETNISYNFLPESETFGFNLEEKSSGNPTTYLSLPDYEAFFCDSEPYSRDFTMDSFVIKSPIPQKNSGSTTIHADISLPDLKCFYFKSEPDLGDLTSIDPGIREIISSTTNMNLPFEDDQSPLFAYVVWIFLPFLTYLVAPPYLLSFGNEDTIFDPC